MILSIAATILIVTSALLFAFGLNLLYLTWRLFFHLSGDFAEQL